MKALRMAMMSAVAGLLIAGSARAVDNTSTIYDGGGVTNMSGDYYVGMYGTNNYLEVRNGTTFTNSGSAYIGYYGNYNRAVITGGGSSWKQGVDLYVGQGGAGNRLLVTNGASLNTIGVGYVGMSASDLANVIHVTGTGSSWTVQDHIVVGYVAPLNQIVVDNGGTLNCGGTVWIGFVQDSNQMTVASGGIVTAPQIYVGVYWVSTPGLNNACTVQGGTLIATNADGTGWLRVNNSGILTVSGGSVVRADYLTLDEVASAPCTLNFVANASGLGAIAVANTFTIGANTKLNIDLTHYAPAQTEILTLVKYGAMPVALNPANVTITGSPGNLAVRQSGSTNGRLMLQPTAWVGPSVRVR